MIEHLAIRNFQSVKHVEMTLGAFNVIVGPSSSGKSAITRALRAVIANKRGSDWITHGERAASITIKTTRGTVTLERSRSQASGNAYTVRPDDPAHPLAPHTVYTKLGGDVPPEVTAFLGIDPKDPITFAGQFDRPYLLDDSAQEVARTLGSLTNVNVIFEGSREATRQRLDSARILKTKSEDLAQIREKIPAYRAIKAQATALTEAQALIEQARAIEQDIASLGKAVETRAVAQSHLASLEPRLAMVIPSEEPLIEAGTALAAYRDALIAQKVAREALVQKVAWLDQQERALASLEAEYARALTHLASGFEAYMIEHGTLKNATPEPAEGLIIVSDAATLAAEYVSGFID